MIRYFRWSPLAKALAQFNPLSENQIVEAASINTKLFCLLAVREASNQSLKPSPQSNRQLFLDLLKAMKVESWNWYDIARASAYLNVLPLQEAPTPGYLIGGILAKTYIHSIPAKQASYTSSIEQLLTEGCWDDIDWHMLLDGRCTKQQLDLSAKAFNREIDLPEQLKAKYTRIDHDLKDHAKAQQLVRMDYIRKPSSKPVQVKTQKSLRMLVEHINELCECQVDLLNDQQLLQPVSDKLASSIASANVLNDSQSIVQDYNFQTLFRLYCALINAKNVTEVFGKLYPKLGLLANTKLGLLKGIGRLGVLLEKAQPEWFIPSLAPVLSKFPYSHSTSAIQSQLSKAAKHFGQAAKQNKLAWSEHQLAAIFINHPQTKLDDVEVPIDKLPLSLSVLLYAKMMDTSSQGMKLRDQLTQAIQQKADQEKLTLTTFFIVNKALMDLKLSTTVGYRCSNLSDFARAVDLLGQLFSKRAPSFHKNIIHSIVPALQIQ